MMYLLDFFAIASEISDGRFWRPGVSQSTLNSYALFLFWIGRTMSLLVADVFYFHIFHKEFFFFGYLQLQELDQLIGINVDPGFLELSIF